MNREQLAKFLGAAGGNPENLGPLQEWVCSVPRLQQRITVRGRTKGEARAALKRVLREEWAWPALRPLPPGTGLERVTP